MTFTSSNGLMVERTLGGLPRVIGEGWSSQLTDPETVALRGFFLHERDEELGRWRWTDNPEWVGVEGDRDSSGGRTVIVMNERTLDRFHANERVRVVGADADEAHRAAQAFFDAHPTAEPPTWVNAHVITWRDGAYLPQIAQRDQHGDLGWYTWLGHDGRWFNVDGLAQLIGDADVTVLVPEPVS